MGGHARPASIALLAAAVALLSGCHSKRSIAPHPGSEGISPAEITDFSRLYSQNCSACHGASGLGGPAIPMANPVYLAIVDRNALRSTIANGEPPTLMPAFARSAGGLLTDQQVDILAKGIFEKWSRPDALGGATPPPYAETQPGDPGRGKQAYATYCARCHGADYAHPGPAGTLFDGSFLALINGQSLRTIILAGRPDLGQPDWRNDVPGHPMTDTDVSDTVTYLLSVRNPAPGQSYGQQPNPKLQPPGPGSHLGEQKE